MLDREVVDAQTKSEGVPKDVVAVARNGTRQRLGREGLRDRRIVSAERGAAWRSRVPTETRSHRGGPVEVRELRRRNRLL